MPAKPPQARAALSSDAQLKAILETAVDGIITIDEAGIMHFVNQSAARLFGYSREELLGQDVTILMPEPYRSEHSKYVGRYLSTGEKRIIGIGREVVGVTKNGAEFPFWLSVAELDLPEGKFFTGMVHDLSSLKRAQNELKRYTHSLEEKVAERTQTLKETIQHLEEAKKELEQEVEDRTKAERALMDSQRLYRIIARNFPQGTINVLDKELRYVFVEGQELYRVGITSEDLIGTRLADRLAVEIREEVENTFRRVFDGEEESIDLEQRGNHYVLSAVPLLNEEKEVDRILVVEKNVTAQKQAERNIKHALQKEKELSGLKSRFVSMASHEFRTPLGTILSSANLLARYNETELVDKRKKHIDRIKSSVYNLTGILNDFLSLDKLEEGRIECKRQEIDLQQLLEETKEELGSMLKPGQQIFSSWTGEPVAFTDPHLVRNMLINLLSNASKYSENDKSIWLKGGQDEAGLSLSVRDEGMGIPKDEQKHLFERFFRANNAVNIQGTGLGLNIVAKYAELLGGKVSFESEEGKGTVFNIALPKSNGDEEEDSAD